MKIFPATKQGRYKLLLFPFEAYIVLVPVVAIVLQQASGYSPGAHPIVDQEIAHRYAVLLYGYIGSTATLLLCAVALRDRSLRRSAIIFGILGLLGILELLPAIAVAKSRSSASMQVPEPDASGALTAHLESVPPSPPWEEKGWGEEALLFCD